MKKPYNPRYSNNEMQADQAVIYTIAELIRCLPQHKEYLKQFPEGKDFVFDVVEALLEDEQTVEEYNTALEQFLPTVEAKLDLLHKIH